MDLETLFQNVPVLKRVHWNPHRPVRKITSDSRNVEPGDLFVACPGSRMDGHDFLGQALWAKAAAIVFERFPETPIPREVTAVCVQNTQACLARLVNRFHGYPDHRVKLVGVTGTNGKTTTAYLLHQLLREKARAAYLGTLWYDVGGSRHAALNTTPGAEVLIPLLQEMCQEEIPYCLMEVSSHALDQCRVHGLRFELAIFTQLTQDHLDYHKNMENYFAAKRLLFEGEPAASHQLINGDCPYGRRLLADHPAARSFALDRGAHYQAVAVESSFQGSRFRLRLKDREVPFQIRLPMRHNVVNVVTALAALDLLGFDPEDFRGALQEIPGIPGRMERVAGSDHFQVFVDYAHTPDAVVNVLSAARQLRPRRVLTLLGCGGDRDRLKRPLMARAAWDYSDLVILTSDNPRSEDPEQILREMQEGIPRTGSGTVQLFEVLDRAQAIERLIALAEPGDVLFVLGKGHENYQILGERKIPFEDRLVVQECLKKKSRVFFS